MMERIGKGQQHGTRDADMTGNRRRRYTTTPEQDRAIAREAARRKLSDQEMFREIVDRGFEACFAERVNENDRDADRIVTAIEELERTVRAGDKAVLAWSSWASFAAFDLLRNIMAGVGRDPNGDGIASREMARFMCETDCNVPTRIWESAGRRMVAGAGYNEALRGACKENGVSWPDFSGSQPENGSGSGNGRKGHTGNHDGKKQRNGKRR